MTTAIREAEQERALQKFWQIDGEAAGLRAALNAANLRIAAIGRAIREAEQERANLVEFMASTSPTASRQADRDRSHAEVSRLDAEITRHLAMQGHAIEQRDALNARLQQVGPLLDGCARLLRQLKILTREDLAA